MAAVIALGSLFILNAVLAAAQAAYGNLPLSRLKVRIAAGESYARHALLLSEDSGRLLATVRFVQALTRFLVAGAAALVFAPLATTTLEGIAMTASFANVIAFVGVMLISTVVVVVLGELVPAALIFRDSVTWAVRLAAPLIVFEWLFYPFARFLTWLSGLIAAPLGGRAAASVTAEQIQTLIAVGEKGGAIEQEEKQMIDSILRFGDTLVREVMIPRVDVLALDEETPLDAALDEVLAAGFSRIPVYQETVDNVLGLLYVKDVLKFIRQGEDDRSLTELLRPAYFVPETKKLDDLLKELQTRHIHMAIVVDEYGGMAGVVTLEDIVEEIIGEVLDEYDPAEEVLIEQVSDTEYLVHGRIDMDDLNYVLGTNLNSVDADTVAGFIYGKLGRVPVVGEQIKVEGVLLEVKHVVGRRIRQVRVLRLEEPIGNGKGANGG